MQTLGSISAFYQLPCMRLSLARHAQSPCNGKGSHRSDKNTGPTENPPRGGPHEGLGVDNSGFADLN